MSAVPSSLPEGTIILCWYSGCTQIAQITEDPDGVLRPLGKWANTPNWEDGNWYWEPFPRCDWTHVLVEHTPVHDLACRIIAIAALTGHVPVELIDQLDQLAGEPQQRIA